MAKLPNKFIPQRGSKRPYIDQDLGYRDTMDRRPAKEDPDYQFRRQSEFKKPYRAKDYPSMEYNFDYPGIGYDWPNGGGDITPGLIDDINNGLWNANFLCSGSPCYCPGEERCFDLGCTWQVVSIKVLDGNITVTGRNYACITAPSENASGGQIQVTQKWGPGSLLREGQVIYGSHVMSVPKCSDCEECADCGTETISYSSQDMTVGLSQNLTITGAGEVAACYDWEISGTGFAFDGVDGSQTTATGLSVTLYAPSANLNCAHSGSTVTLKCGGVVKDTVSFSATTAGLAEGTYYTVCPPCSYQPGGAACAWVHDWYCVCGRYNCYGTYLSSGNYCCVGNSEAECLSCSGTSVCNATNDLRQPANIAAGCCPAALY